MRGQKCMLMHMHNETGTCSRGENVLSTQSESAAESMHILEILSICTREEEEEKGHRAPALFKLSTSVEDSARIVA